METTKATITQTISRRVRVDNSTDEARLYDISAEATIGAGSLENISAGYVRALGGEASEPRPAELADFRAHPYLSVDFRAYPYLSVDFHTHTDRAAILQAIEEFKQAVAAIAAEP